MRLSNDGCKVSRRIQDVHVGLVTCWNFDRLELTGDYVGAMK